MLPSGSASKRKLRLVIRIRLEIHESCFPLRDKTVFTEMATAPVEEGTELEAAASPSLGKRVFGDLRVETYGKISGAEMLVAADSLPFTCGNPSTELAKGLIHIYKDRSAASSPPQPMLCMLAIPSSLRCADLLNFVAPTNQCIQRIRILRDSSSTHYMALLYFESLASATDFYKTFHGTPFSSLEKQRCCVLVHVSKVETLSSSSKGNVFPPNGCTELPSCPVCLEKMDESIITTTILTALCNHSFHAECLTRWEDNTCPVCRYVQTPELVEDNSCAECGETEHLWICVVCGHVGCGRYTGGHAHNHFLQTHHTYTMELGSQRVWDYAGDNYVHRLVHNKTDGKLVEVPGTSDDIADTEKLDSLQLEYTYLLTSQLESQRHYFEGKVAQIETAAQEQLSLVEERLKTTVLECERLQSVATELQSDKKAVEKKNQQLQTRMHTLETELKEEIELNKCMSDNQRLWRDRIDMMEKKMDLTIKQKELEVKELQDQVRDVMFYLDAQKKVDGSEEKQELQEGHVIISQQNNPGMATAGAVSSTNTTGSGKKPRKKRK
ncbi:BRCA1-associated protein-like [Dysidea avara]|uniref:BRCA1-associated protein-like n=1 Tax=Dysidea avara TaxID=196820 RepID=UPI00332464A0